MRLVEHAALGFALQVPDAWQTTELPEGLVAGSEEMPDDLSLPPGFAVSLAGFGDGDHDAASLSEQGLLEETRWLTDLRLLDSEDTELASGLPARRTLATYRQGVSSLTLEQWHAVHRGRALVISATGPTQDYAALHDVWHAMAASLRLGDEG
ncbi:MAG: hypothetical protein QOE11_2150 [Solirubrobacteraceae bacterium]|jgi:hypothetical protein|nr:hypothetical protein [Solirubrobacteraceae bacterium]